MYILIKIHIFYIFGFSGRVCKISGSGRVGFVIFFSGSGRVRVSKKPSGRVGFSGFRVPDPSLHPKRVYWNFSLWSLDDIQKMRKKKHKKNKTSP